MCDQLSNFQKNITDNCLKWRSNIEKLGNSGEFSIVPALFCLETYHAYKHCVRDIYCIYWTNPTFMLINFCMLLPKRFLFIFSVNIDNKVGAIGFVSRIIPSVYPISIIRADPDSGEPIRGPDGLCQVHSMVNGLAIFLINSVCVSSANLTNRASLLARSCQTIRLVLSSATWTRRRPARKS